MRSPILHNVSEFETRIAVSDTGQRIQARRESLKMSRAELAKKLETTRLRVWRMETGVTPVHADDLPAIASALSTTSDELVA